MQSAGYTRMGRLMVSACLFTNLGKLDYLNVESIGTQILERYVFKIPTYFALNSRLQILLRPLAIYSIENHHNLCKNQKYINNPVQCM